MRSMQSNDEFNVSLFLPPIVEIKIAKPVDMTPQITTKVLIIKVALESLRFLKYLNCFK